MWILLLFSTGLSATEIDDDGEEKEDNRYYSSGDDDESHIHR